ncbi:hypothetical protein M409DRAFT_64362 [Zasmidium cellare ATCC 36951]|uniref:Cupin type-1 domain-containing protein n=1 Tax=Zasmidium cellare ATCC 36951 TaxID=1080233 RepID=A0A6A6CS87_ZASCE|nr:uncharacterized protein M409DRAFT_64362 [Zasmidium cellare ATCC 36951]KAF2169951.1 hypothetical protein M409DRAFT_64362 [Zasmidium cellare ATCC 36951]
MSSPSLSSPSDPELYWTKPTPHSPNSKLPVLVYRNVLPGDHSVESTSKAFEDNQWSKGGVFKHVPIAHFHSNTHECYAAIRGSTKWVCVRRLYGVGPLDDQSAGITFDMKAGDIAVHAAGVTHKNLESSDDYEYVGLYPKDAPHWDNNLCKADTDETRLKAEAAKEVAIPDHDPIYGLDGPLPRIWKSVT